MLAWAVGIWHPCGKCTKVWFVCCLSEGCTTKTFATIGMGLQMGMMASVQQALQSCLSFEAHYWPCPFWVELQIASFQRGWQHVWLVCSLT
jgi:hypothetical protein